MNIVVITEDNSLDLSRQRYLRLQEANVIYCEKDRFDNNKFYYPNLPLKNTYVSIFIGTDMEVQPGKAKVYCNSFGEPLLPWFLDENGVLKGDHFFGTDFCSVEYESDDDNVFIKNYHLSYHDTFSRIIIKSIWRGSMENLSENLEHFEFAITRALNAVS